MRTWDDVLAESRLTRSAPTLGDERPRPAVSGADDFASPSAGRTAPRSGRGGPALAAALDRAEAPVAPWPNVDEAIAQLEAAMHAEAKKADLLAALERVRALGLLLPTPF